MATETATFVPEYRYRIKSTGYSSTRYGNCEVCKQPVSEVFLQSEQRSYEGGSSWTYEGCNTSLFDHEDCLLSVRRGQQS